MGNPATIVFRSGFIIIWHYNFTNLGFPEIRGFPLLNHHLGWGRVRSLKFDQTFVILEKLAFNNIQGPGPVTTPAEYRRKVGMKLMWFGARWFGLVGGLDSERFPENEALEFQTTGPQTNN